MARNDHFEFPKNWTEAAGLLSFSPVALDGVAGFELKSLAVHVHDHKYRDLPVEERTLEAHYGGFTFSQRRHPTEAYARHHAIEVSYGSDPTPVTIAGQEGHSYEGDSEHDDEALPAVVVWHNGNMFYLLASHDVSADELSRIAKTVRAK